VVTLTGYMDSLAEKWAAERAAKRVSGVKAVAEEIKSGCLPLASARAAANALEWNIQMPHDRIKVTVQDGRITLEGKVNRQFQKKAAEDAVRHLTGVRGITNQLTFRSEVEPAEVATKIRRALNATPG
jgi:osmotically-inducible protein OsmY